MQNTILNLKNIEPQREENPLITKRKVFEMKPMTEAEAICQMNLLKHPFFLFYNAEIDNMCVIYKRKNGTYGIIETDFL